MLNQVVSLTLTRPAQRFMLLEQLIKAVAL